MYICSCCKQSFEEAWTEEEALAEMKENFGEAMTKEACDIVCDDCYKQMFH